MYTKPTRFTSLLLLSLLPNLGLALKTGEKAFDVRATIVGSIYSVAVSRSVEPANRYPITLCESHPDAKAPLQLEMECSLSECRCDSCREDCAQFRGDLATPIKVVLQQPPMLEDGRSDFNTSGVNFIFEAEG